MLSVLLIDDDQVDRQAIRRMALAMPVQVDLVQAETAREGLLQAELKQFDCVLLDYSLPDMEGIDILSALVQRDLPIVVLTGRDYEETALETLRAGAQEYMEKQQLNATRLYQAICSSKERQDLLLAHRSAEEEKARLGQIIEDSQSEIWLVDVDSHRLLMISTGAKKNIGLEATDETPLMLADLLSEFNEDSFNAEIAPLLNGKEDQISLETKIRRLNGSFYQVEVVMQISRTEKNTAVVLYITDLTERITASEKIRQMQKMEALGIMTGGIAHDFNNMLTSVVGGLGLLERQELSDKSRRYLSLAQGSVDRAVKLTGRLLSFSRLQILKPHMIKANEFVQDLLPLLESSIDGDAKIKVKPYEHELCMEIDKIELESCLINLCINSRDALAEGGEITISLGKSSLPEINTEDHRMVEGDYVEITVEDNGSGMDEEALQKAFDPFFTTKAVGKGSGLGLSMVFGFARQTGGNVTVESELGKGTKIRLYFPMSKAPADALESEQVGNREAQKPGRGCGERILLVEDDREIREFAVMALEELGYEIVIAGDGKEAVERLEDAPGFDLLFTDIVMPGELNGVAVAEKFRKKFPSKPVIYTSGYTRNAILPGDTLPQGSQFLSKPYDLQQLTAVLSETIHANAA